MKQSSLEYKVLKTIKENNLFKKGDRVVVAVSGGADSICLLYLLNELKKDLNISVSACHYNHKIRGVASDKDQKFVEKICQEWGIECSFGFPSEKKPLKNEEEARVARYSFFEEILKNTRGEAKIAIAHTSNDLIETFVFRLVRGSGLRGLKSIPLSRKNFTRPLLFVSRSEIEEFLIEKNINFITDKTNYSLKYTRNFIRLKVIPLLLKINPNLIETVKESIAAIEEDYQYIEEEAKKHYQKLVISANSQEISLKGKELSALSPSLRKNIIRVAIEKLGLLTDITFKHINEIDSLAQKGEGKKYKLLPHSLRVEYLCGKIIFSKGINKGTK